MIVLGVLSALLNLFLLYVLLVRRCFRQYRIAMQEGEEPAEPVNPAFRRFIVRRHIDVTGISGTGVPVEGVVFSDGWGVSHWLDRPPMWEPKTEIWHRPWHRRRGKDPFTKISGHGGKTEVVWIDQ